MDLETVGNELYGLTPGEFVTVRDARALEAKRDGDRELAAAVKKMRRPTTGAWLANLLVRERRDMVTELVDLGEVMRQAQKDLAGGDLRRLSQQRRQLVAALGSEARQIADERGHRVNESTIHELEATLEAALADAAAAEALRSGCLTVTLRYSGFGSVDLTGAVGVPADERPARDLRRKPKPPAASATRGQSVGERRRQKGLDRAEQHLAETQAALAVAERAAADAEDRLVAAHRDRARLDELMTDLEQRLRTLRDDHVPAKRAEREAQKNHDVADRNVRAARGRVAQATEDLENLRSNLE